MLHWNTKLNKLVKQKCLNKRLGSKPKCLDTSIFLFQSKMSEQKLLFQSKCIETQNCLGSNKMETAQVSTSSHVPANVHVHRYRWDKILVCCIPRAGALSLRSGIHLVFVSYEPSRGGTLCIFMHPAPRLHLHGENEKFAPGMAPAGRKMGTFRIFKSLWRPRTRSADTTEKTERGMRIGLGVSSPGHPLRSDVWKVLTSRQFFCGHNNPYY